MPLLPVQPALVAAEDTYPALHVQATAWELPPAQLRPTPQARHAHDEDVVNEDA